MPMLTATPIERDVVIVSGADAVEHLQTQLTQDVAALGPGESAWSFILTPKSEIEALVRVTRVADGVVLDVAPGGAGAVRGRLDGMLFRMDVSFDEAVWPGVAWRGDGALGVGSEAPVVAPLPWSSIEALDEIGPGVAPPTNVPALSRGDLEALRVEEGWPAEPEIDGTATPAMTGIVDRTVSFTKGCYTGQEFVARVHHRDATPPRRLVKVSFAANADVGPGAAVRCGDEVVGTVTSAVANAGRGLAYLKRSVDTPCSATCGEVPIMLLGIDG